MAYINTNPTIYRDMNELFPVLNSKVGLSHEQIKVMIENSNYLKNNLMYGIIIGKTDTIVVDDAKQAKLEVSIRTEIVGGNKVAYLDITNYVFGGSSGGAVESVNGKTGNVELDAESVGAVAEKVSVSIAQGGETQAILKNSINQFSYTTQDVDADGNISNQETVDIFPRGMNFHGLKRPVVNGLEQMAYLSDLETLIGGVSDLLGDTEDLEV